MRVSQHIKTIIRATHDVLVDIIVHTASSIDSNIASYLINALSQRRKVSGEETYFIHVSFLAFLRPLTR